MKQRVRMTVSIVVVEFIWEYNHYYYYEVLLTSSSISISMAPISGTSPGTIFNNLYLSLFKSQFNAQFLLLLTLVLLPTQEGFVKPCFTCFLVSFYLNLPSDKIEFGAHTGNTSGWLKIDLKITVYKKVQNQSSRMERYLKMQKNCNV